MLAQPESAARSNYLAKDYETFRQLMLDHLALVVPGWEERHAADLGIAIVELLAYAADYLSYYQDAVATEAYLKTARQRVSLRRHARLLDYKMGEGCNARVWVQLQVSADDVSVLAGTALLPRLADPRPLVSESTLQEYGGLVFETMHDVTLYRAHNLMVIDASGHTEYSLLKGGCEATLSGHFPQLSAGDVLIFEQIDDPLRSSMSAPAQPHAVRLKSPPELSEENGNKITRISWMEEDALPESYLVCGRDVDGRLLMNQCVALGNIVLADHGRRGQTTLPPIPYEGTYKHSLAISALTHCEPYDHWAFSNRPARAALVQDDEQIIPRISLQEFDPRLSTDPAEESQPRYLTGEKWTAHTDLMASDRFCRDFVAEIQEDTVGLRFGDGIFGRPPSPGTAFVAIHRTGQGTVGNIGPDTLRHIVSDDGRIVRVRNPLPATGGKEPETLDQVRLAAPHAFRRPRRCVLASDYEQILAGYPDVSAVIAQRDFSGESAVVRIWIARTSSAAVDQVFVQDVVQFMEPVRLIGDELLVSGAAPIPFSVIITLSVLSGSSQSEVRLRVESAVLSYFDQLRMGAPVYRSKVLSVAAEAAGVASVAIDLITHGADEKPVLHTDKIEPAQHEVLHLEKLEVTVRETELEGRS